jgi:hypothetical protein
MSLRFQIQDSIFQINRTEKFGIWNLEFPNRLAFLFGVLAARAECPYQHGPAAVAARRHRFAEQTAHQRAAAPPAAGTGADAGAFAHLLESFRASLDSLKHGAFADFVADASGLEIFYDGLGFGVLCRVDGVLRKLIRYCQDNFTTKTRRARSSESLLSETFALFVVKKYLHIAL